MKEIEVYERGTTDIPFEPFILEIHVNDEADLQELWLRMNLSTNNIKEYEPNTGESYFQDPKRTKVRELWDILDTHAQKEGIKTR